MNTPSGVNTATPPPMRTPAPPDPPAKACACTPLRLTPPEHMTPCPLPPSSPPNNLCLSCWCDDHAPASHGLAQRLDGLRHGLRDVERSPHLNFRRWRGRQGPRHWRRPRRIGAHDAQHTKVGPCANISQEILPVNVACCVHMGCVRPQEGGVWCMCSHLPSLPDYSHCVTAHSLTALTV